MPSEQDRTDLSARLMGRSPRAPRDAASPGAVRSTPVRITTDLGPIQHQDLTTYCAELAARAGVARIYGSEVVRALLDRLQEDPDLHAAISQEIMAARKTSRKQ